MKIERNISWFDKKTELIVSEHNIDSIGLDILKRIFTPYPDDPLMYDAYDITAHEANELNKYVDFKFEFDKYLYELSCYQV